ncbi:beta-galactosidase [Rathayibacter tritici]|nr:beta-galactosidase [Rathayibacter tritici]PPF30798.1 beta-galactosidase [Rathayibacter tritici]PPF68197.1 beta-galactosidase [Rathayibacter tritici]PPG08080.1 beta-galactosidase [Rathayibacter tritici]PPI20122.1 beta-galactosidase [Rathayibacter tritici]PPI50246.1 beta-galactosidase [Rathayibacter tritici]
MPAAPRFSGVLFGAAYYVEYQPEGVLERDLDLMAEAGFTVIRVGESVWSTWEPREGVFDLDWLEPVLDAAHARGISVILGTPTYAIPPWLQRLHPEIAAESRTGVRMGWGARQEMDQSHPAYRFYADRIARKVVARYADHPAIIGYQVDNEPGNHLPHNEHTFQRFVGWLRERYGTVEDLNREWGLVYWSHRLSDWADLWRPDGNLMPQYQLEWRRFQSTLANELIAWQADLVREYAREDQFVTTCIAYSQAQISDDEIVAPLDVVAGNPYYKMQGDLDATAEVPRERPWWGTGVWALFEWGDRAFSSAQTQYLVTETNAQSINGSWTNHPPYPGQIKQAALALLARGGRMIEYWHWHTLHFGIETYWGGVLPHSQQPGRIYREVADLGATLKALGPALDEYEPDADVLMLYSTDTKWSFEFTPPLARADGSPDSRAYLTIFDAFYRGLFEAGAQIRVQHLRQFVASDITELVRRYPVLIAPAVYVADDAMLEHLRAYAEAGGHLVLGIRTGYADELARARLAVAPAFLTDAAGVHYDEYSNIDAPMMVHAEGDLALEEGAAGTEWVDVLEVDDADVLLRYEPTELEADAAVTTHAFGAGRVSSVGTVPNPALGRSIGRWLVPDTQKSQWHAGDSVSVSTGTTGHSRVVFLSNWSAAATSVTTPAPARDLVTGATYAAGDSVPLDRRGAAVLEIALDATE